MANLFESLEAHFFPPLLRGWNVFCYSTFWNPFVFCGLSKDWNITHRKWLQSDNNEINPTIYLPSLYWPHYRLKVSSILVKCSISLWWDAFFVRHVYVRVRAFVPRPCLLYHFRASIASMLGTMIHVWRKNESAKFLRVGVHIVKIVEKKKNRRWNELLLSSSSMLQLDCL